MGVLGFLVLLQLALSIAGGTLLARKGNWLALASALALPAVLLLLGAVLVFADGYQAESWARALPFVAAGAVILSGIGAIAAFAAYRLKQ